MSPIYSATNFADVCRQLDIPVSAEQAAACAFLEQRGYRFLLDFGITSSVSIMRQIIEEEQEAGEA